jgi:aspartate 1-decarboxylase
MAEPSKSLRQVLVASVRGLTVTQLEWSGADALVLDAGVVAAAGLLPFEKVEVMNLTSGARFATCLVVGRSAPGGVAVSGPAAHFAAAGDVLVVSAWAWMREKAASRHQPRVVSVDARNRVCRSSRELLGGPTAPTGAAAGVRAAAGREG